MKNVIYFILILSIQACGGSSAIESTATSENEYDPPELLTLYDRFLNEADRFGRDSSEFREVSFYFTNMGKVHSDNGGFVVGKCDYDLQEVAIDRTWFKHASDVSREILVFHELGHCVMQLHHSHELDSIMNPNVDYISRNYLDSRDDYLQEFFSRYR